MSLKIYLVFIQLPVLIWTCSSDIGGSSSKSAEFGISFFAPIVYTYPDTDTDLFPGQSLTMDLAKNKVKTDLDLAIAKGLTANQIYLYVPPTLDITFTPPQVHIVDGDKCETDNTYVAISGTVLYRCAKAAVTEAPATNVTSGSSQTTVVPADTTTVIGSTTTRPEVADNDELAENSIVNSGETQFNRRPRRRAALPRRRAASTDVKANPFTQSMTVVATASQPLFENQWKQIARSVQQALEAKKLLFNDEIQVVLL